MLCIETNPPTGKPVGFLARLFMTILVILGDTAFLQKMECVGFVLKNVKKAQLFVPNNVSFQVVFIP